MEFVRSIVFPILVSQIQDRVPKYWDSLKEGLEPPDEFIISLPLESFRSGIVSCDIPKLDPSAFGSIEFPDELLEFNFVLLAVGVAINIESPIRALGGVFLCETVVG